MAPTEDTFRGIVSPSAYLRRVMLLKAPLFSATREFGTLVLFILLRFRDGAPVGLLSPSQSPLAYEEMNQAPSWSVTTALNSLI
jgi:hypothetical protein